MKARVTQRDVAREAGVSHVTVSLALRESPTIPESTQKRIKEIAERLGYSPDPMLAALSSYRTQQRPAAHQANIAWLYNNPEASTKGSFGDFGDYLKGAAARAQQLGYILDEINISGEYEDPKRLRRLLDARNITGLVLSPCGTHLAPASHEFNFDLTRYSAVRIGYSYRAPLLNTVANAQFRTVLTAMRNAIDLGYERICMLLTREVDKRTSWQFLGGYLAGIHLLPKKNWFDPYYIVPGEHWQDAFFLWLEKHKIDCVVGAGFGYICHDMIRRGLRVPDDVGYIDTQLPQGETFLTGVDQNPRQIGVASIDLLVSMMHRHDIGIPEIASHLLIEGSWRGNKTTSRRLHVPA